MRSAMPHEAVNRMEGGMKAFGETALFVAIAVVLFIIARGVLRWEVDFASGLAGMALHQAVLAKQAKEGAQ